MHAFFIWKIVGRGTQGRGQDDAKHTSTTPFKLRSKVYSVLYSSSDVLCMLAEGCSIHVHIAAKAAASFELKNLQHRRGKGHGGQVPPPPPYFCGATPTITNSVVL